MISEKDIEQLQKKHPVVLIAYGGDGTLASKWREAYSAKKPIWPIRNYGMCQRHKTLLKALLDEDDLRLKDANFNQTLCPLAEISMGNAEEHSSALALNEIQVKNNDITEALRFDVYVNSKKYYENVIADGVVFSTPNGATGYWKSLTRTMFRDGCGLAFIAPTVGISSLVLKRTDKVKLVLSRAAVLNVSYDKLLMAEAVDRGFEIGLQIAADNMSIIGYDHFMCYYCRKNRNSTILQDQYII